MIHIGTWLRAIWCSTTFVGIAVLLMMPGQAAAQTGQRCFAETGYCVSGRFLQYWQEHGGLPVFGLPLSASISENGGQVQYFERQRFELHPENQRPYDVLLGRLGAQLLGPATGLPANGPANGCIWFSETRHTVCNQQIGTGFAGYWQTHGLEFDGLPAGKSYQESLALFGYPLTEAANYTLPNGQMVIAQWFERARFEWYPNNPNPYKVQLGLLGAVIRPWTPGPWTPEPELPQVSQVQIFLTSLGGGSVGCGDQVVPVTRSVAATPAPLTAALNELFSLKSKDYGESGFYNALYQSDISIDRVAIVHGVAQVGLSGTARTAGVCDKPRIIAQIEQTVRQFSSIANTTITLNGQSLVDAVQ